MPHVLTKQQKEYLTFIKDYIQENEMSPSLKEVSEHFGVKSPTAHNILKALQHKDFIQFIRSSEGFHIRLVERGGMIEKVFPLHISGTIDQYGEVEMVDLPSSIDELLEPIPIFQKGANLETTFGLQATQRIPQAGIEAGDILVLDSEKMPQHGFMSLLPVGPMGRSFLCWSRGKTMDDRFFSPEVGEPYPLPELFVDKDLGQRMYWWPIAWDDENKEYFGQLVEQGGFPQAPIPPDLIQGTVLELIRDYG